MILVRLALVTAREIPDRWRKSSLTIGKISVNQLGWAERETSQSLIAYGELDLRYKPKITSEKLIVIPQRERSTLEAALECFANLLAISEGIRRKLSSPSPCVALIPENDSDRHFLSGAIGILHEGHSTIPDVVRHLDYASMSEAFVDRLDGIALLAEALSQEHAAGRFRDLVRVLERAFHQTGRTLTQSLSEFLGGTKLGYTEEEIQQWIYIRGRVSHADQGRAVVLEKDVAWLVHRTEQAAYDVLLNKEVWKSSNTGRRYVWQPVVGTSSPNGDLFLTSGEAATLRYYVFDPFRCFRQDLGGILKDYPETWWTGPFQRRGEVRVSERES